MKHEHHGDTGTRLYRIWKSMKCRCYNPNHPSFVRYGKRGIRVCDEWKQSYTKFKDWALSHGYADDLEIERVDVNDGYHPDNCKWIKHHEQTLNRRDTLYIVIGETVSRLRDFSQQRGISINSVKGWRHLGILEEKLSERLGQPVTVIGGKAGD